MDLWADQLAEFRHISIAMVRYIAVFFSTQVMFKGPKDGLAKQDQTWVRPAQEFWI